MNHFENKQILVKIKHRVKYIENVKSNSFINSV